MRCKTIVTQFTISGQSLIPNLYVITGHGSKGWTLSFGSFELLTDLIDGKKPQVSFILLRNLWGIMV